MEVAHSLKQSYLSKCVFVTFEAQNLLIKSLFTVAFIVIEAD
jgi:hypothetical protein